MTSKINQESDSVTLRRILESGSDEELAGIADSLFNAAEDDASFANIAADWLQYGRYGIPKDEERAAVFRAKAIQALIPDAIYDHALILESHGDSKKALPFYILSAVLGDADAMSSLSEYFLYGEEFETDYFISGALKKHENLTRRREREAE